MAHEDACAVHPAGRGRLAGGRGSAWRVPTNPHQRALPSLSRTPLPSESSGELGMVNSCYCTIYQLMPAPTCLPHFWKRGFLRSEKPRLRIPTNTRGKGHQEVMSPPRPNPFARTSWSYVGSSFSPEVIHPWRLSRNLVPPTYGRLLDSVPARKFAWPSFVPELCPCNNTQTP